MVGRERILLLMALLVIATLLATGCGSSDGSEPKNGLPATRAELATPQDDIPNGDYPKIASWLAKKDEIIASGKPYDLIMTGLVISDEADKIRVANPNAKILAGLTTNWVWENPDWKTFLTTVASYGTGKTFEITEDMYLRKPDGSRCPFGWASEEWQQQEIYAMDPRNHSWVDLITSFYKNLLEQPQHDGIIVDMVIETSLCREAVSDADWIEATRAIMTKIEEYNTEGKLVIFNSGRDFSEIDAFADFMDGYVMENFMGNQLKATYEEGLHAAQGNYIVVYAVDTDDTGRKDLKKMRLGLTLSLLNDNTYFTYDFGPRDHGQAWWFPEYDADLGNPLGPYYEKDGSYQRDFQNGTVVSSPNSDVTVTFDTTHTDASTGDQSHVFEVHKGDGRIFLKSEG